MRRGEEPPNDLLDEDSPLRMEVYTADGQAIGRIVRYLDQVPEDTIDFQFRHVDPIGPDGKVIGARHFLIDGYGYPLQAEIIVAEDQINVDLRGRRATLPLTMDQIRALPRHEPALPTAPPLNT